MQPAAAGPLRPSPPFELRHASTDHPLLVVAPERRLLVIDGAGRRSGADFRFASEVLRAIEEVLRDGRHDPFAGTPRSVLEVAWSMPPIANLAELDEALEPARRRGWRQLLEVRRTAADETVLAAIERASRAAGRATPLARLVNFTEGRAAQMLHLGGDGGIETIRRLYGQILEAGWRPCGDLHELVLADADTVPRMRARSIFRVPVEAATVIA